MFFSHFSWALGAGGIFLLATVVQAWMTLALADEQVSSDVKPNTTRVEMRPMFIIRFWFSVFRSATSGFQKNSFVWSASSGCLWMAVVANGSAKKSGHNSIEGVNQSCKVSVCNRNQFPGLRKLIWLLSGSGCSRFFRVQWSTHWRSKPSREQY